MFLAQRPLNAETNTPEAAEELEATPFPLDSVIAIAILWFIGFSVLVMIWRWRCALFELWSWTTLSFPNPCPPPPPGLKNSALQSLPTASYTSQVATSSPADCAICLTEFADGDLTRMLPQCGHLFHVGCVDKWLGSHSSCPSCRQVVVVCRGVSADQKV